jgi:endo-1,4-beta-xylanase
MKPQGIYPAEDCWNFDAPDRFVEFAKKNDLKVVGHCLVWAKGDGTDEWMKQGKDGQAVSRDELLARIEDHVATVVSRYHATATMWDVVNEALADGDDGYSRASVYSTTTGIDFIDTAFRTAQKHDPVAVLIYNDYNCHFQGKRKKMIRLLTELKEQERGVPVDAYGMQGHFELGDDSLAQLKETIAALGELDLQVVVSERDFDVVTRGKWWAEDGKFREELKTFDP